MFAFQSLITSFVNGSECVISRAPSVVMSSCVSAILQGLAELVHGQQPTFSLVSNGVEFIMLDKRFYVDHAPQALMRRLRAEVVGPTLHV